MLFRLLTVAFIVIVGFFTIIIDDRFSQEQSVLSGGNQSGQQFNLAANTAVDLSDDLQAADQAVTEQPRPSPAQISTPNQTEQTVIDSKASTKASNSQATESLVLFKVPFAAQAPFGSWNDPKQQNGCEEASVLMAMRWADGASLTDEEALKEIIAIADYQTENFGTYHDTSAADTTERIIRGYFNHQAAEVKYNIVAEDIITELRQEHLVIVPVNGRILKNPHYTQPGPERHMLLIIGYDPASQEFITNDPGTRWGENYRYQADRLLKAIRDYPSGDNTPITEDITAMIIVKKS